MKDTPTELKTIVPAICPHCSKDILVEYRHFTPALDSVYTMEDVKKAKADLVNKVRDLDMDQEEKNEIMEWAASETTLFGPNEVDEIINNIKNQNDTPKEVKN